MFKEFKEFIAKGNVLDLAVAVLIGAAFGKIITSFTSDILTPIIGAFGKADFSALAIQVGAAQIKYGMFINAVIDFLIVAWVLFMIVKAANKMKKPTEGPTPPETKDCPFCLSTIPAAATRCSACTSQL
ncbi:MAG TPA: large conductance mechanosensitive channel protein MscL [Armatimonadota bacterium]|jgi:large conductance mechanosensitive channel